MNIGEAAERSGLPAKTIRYYEEIDLIQPARSENGYRNFSPSDIHRMQFLHRARGLGFSVEDCRALLALYDDKNRASADVRHLAKSHLGEIDRKIAELETLRATLAHLVEACHGDDRPDCPILNDLAGSALDR
ncbi:MAG TPA: Cu(I)-responsive transcriptional regulator [Rhodospirillaceae bacterium]|nr:Cu(I)-responsive transcriptional regulator [Rhodospirillaceae bacterium]HAT36836.1 Cu(I)-responsive transcriptional regulator [Rhodospirillaceae bacterium]